MVLATRSTLRRFERGWISDVSRAADIDAFRLPEGWWESHTQVGALVSAPGRSETANATNDISSLYRAENSSGTVLRLVQEDTAVKVLNASGTIGATLKSGLTAGKRLSYTVMGDGTNEYILCFNGTDTPFKIKISDQAVSNIGLTRPSVTNASTSNNAGGNNSVRGVVSYFISQLSTTTEGALSTSFGEIDCGDGNRVDIDLSHADFSSKVYKIYRTYKDGFDPYYVGQIDTSSVTTFTDDVPDSELSDPSYANGDVPPASGTSCITYFSRVYVMSGNDLYWSDIGQPESYATWAGGNRLTVGHNDGDVGTVIARDSDGILFFKKGHLYKIFGREPREFEVHEIIPSDQPARSIGTPGINSLTYTPGGIVFYFDGGFYVYRNNQVRRISSFIEDDIQNLIGDGDFDESGLWDVSLGYQPATSRVWASIRNSTLFWDVRSDRFVGAMKTGFRCYMSDDFGNSENFFCGGSRGDVGSHDTTKIYTADLTSTQALDHAIYLYPFGEAGQYRRFLYVDLVFKNDSASTENIDFFADVDGQRVATISAQAVTDTTQRTFITSRFNIGAEGYNCEVTITADSGQNSTRAMTLYSATMYYQEMGIGSGMLRAS